MLGVTQPTGTMPPGTKYAFHNGKNSTGYVTHKRAPDGRIHLGPDIVKIQNDPAKVKFRGPCCGGTKAWGDGKGHTLHQYDGMPARLVYMCYGCHGLLDKPAAPEPPAPVFVPPALLATKMTNEAVVEEMGGGWDN